MSEIALAAALESTTMPSVYMINAIAPTQLIDLMRDKDVRPPISIEIEQLANIRLIHVTKRIRNIPFDIVKINGVWFIDHVFNEEFSNFFKKADRLWIIDKTTITDHLDETNVFKLILYSTIPFIIWVSWDPEVYLEHSMNQCRSVFDRQCIAAKSYLLQTRSHTDINLYDRLSLILAQSFMNSTTVTDALLSESSLSNMQYPIIRSDLREFNFNAALPMNKMHLALLRRKSSHSRSIIASSSTIIVPDMIDLAYFCSNSGYGLHMNEMILLWSAMKLLTDRFKFNEIRFWGKIFGLHCDYYIVEVQHDAEISFEQINILPMTKLKSEKKKVSNCEILAETSTNLINSLPADPHGIGMNRYSYFVTNSPGLPWTKLPDVTPAMIESARKVRQFFTGCLSSSVSGYPNSFQSEKDYLRAQIARITASTHISPAGFYLLDNVGTEEQGFDEEETIFAFIQSQRKNQPPNIIRNRDYNNELRNLITVHRLADSDLQEWVHSHPEIVIEYERKIFRPTSSNTFDLSEVDAFPETEEERSFREYDLTNNIQRHAAPLLRPISDDQALFSDQSAWSIGLTMSIMQEYNQCFVRSNLWPGAFTLGHPKNHINLYIGWGMKYQSFYSNQLPAPELEYPKNFIEVIEPSTAQLYENRESSNDIENISEESLTDDVDEQLMEEEIE